MNGGAKGVISRVFHFLLVLALYVFFSDQSGCRIILIKGESPFVVDGLSYSPSQLFVIICIDCVNWNSICINESKTRVLLMFKSNSTFFGFSRVVITLQAKEHRVRTSNKEEYMFFGRNFSYIKESYVDVFRINIKSPHLWRGTGNSTELFRI